MMCRYLDKSCRYSTDPGPGKPMGLTPPYSRCSNCLLVDVLRKLDDLMVVLT